MGANKMMEMAGPFSNKESFAENPRGASHKQFCTLILSTDPLCMHSPYFFFFLSYFYGFSSAGSSLRERKRKRKRKQKKLNKKIRRSYAKIDNSLLKQSTTIIDRPSDNLKKQPESSNQA
jgi:hypothetical protein